MKTLDRIERGWSAHGGRLGQYFVNHYIKGDWPALFYEEDTGKAKAMVRQWLIDNCYSENMPPRCHQ